MAFLLGLSLFFNLCLLVVCIGQSRKLKQAATAGNFADAAKDGAEALASKYKN